MRKNIVLIDFESIQPSSLEALEHDHFRVLVFVGANQTKVPFIADIPLVKAAAIKSPTERAALFVTKLEQPKVTKPRTLKTLSSAVATHFQKQLSNEDIAAVVSAMEASGFLSIDSGKIVYTANAQG